MDHKKHEDMYHKLCQYLDFMFDSGETLKGVIVGHDAYNGDHLIAGSSIAIDSCLKKLSIEIDGNILFKTRSVMLKYLHVLEPFSDEDYKKGSWLICDRVKSSFQGKVVCMFKKQAFS